MADTDHRLRKPLHLYLDMELNVLHSDLHCPGMKFPVKYQYYRSIVVHQLSEAEALDRRYGACDRCKKMEAKKRSPERKRSFRYSRRGSQE